MDAVAEPEVRPVAAADVEDVGGWEPARVAVDRPQAYQRLFARGDLHAVEGHRLGRHPERGMRDRGGEADELVDRGGKLPRIGQQRLELAGVVQQGHHPVADQAGRGVVAGDDELEQARQQLLGGERVAFGGGGQDADQVAGRTTPLGVEATMPSDASTASAGGSPAHPVSSTANQACRRGRSAAGMPSSSPITPNGSGYFARVRKDSAALREGLPVTLRPRRRSSRLPTDHVGWSKSLLGP